MSLRRWSITLERRQLHTSINRLLEGESTLVDCMLLRHLLHCCQKWILRLFQGIVLSRHHHHLPRHPHRRLLPQVMRTVLKMILWKNKKIPLYD